MRILIIGHKGFIGSALTAKMKAGGIVCDGYDLQDGQDIRNAFQLDNVLEFGHYDAVIHLASVTGNQKCEEYADECIGANIAGVKNVVDLCEKHGVRKLIYFSTSAVLGEGEEGAFFDENSPYNPQSFYATSRVTGEMIVKSCVHTKYTIIRPFNVYGGEGDPKSLYYCWLDQIKNRKALPFVGDGNLKRCFVHLDDLAEGILPILRTNRADNQIIHLGGTEIISLKEIYDIFTFVRRKRKILIYTEYFEEPEDTILYSAPNITKASQLLAFRPKPRFKDFLLRLLFKELK